MLLSVQSFLLLFFTFWVTLFAFVFIDRAKKANELLLRQNSQCLFQKHAILYRTWPSFPERLLQASELFEKICILKDRPHILKEEIGLDPQEQTAVYEQFRPFEALDEPPGGADRVQVGFEQIINYVDELLVGFLVGLGQELGEELGILINFVKYTLQYCE